MLATEMEASALYTVSMLRGLRAGVVLAVIGSTHEQQEGGSSSGATDKKEESESFLASPELAAETKVAAIDTAVGAIRLLIAHDNGGEATTGTAAGEAGVATGGAGV